MNIVETQFKCLLDEQLFCLNTLGSFSFPPPAIFHIWSFRSLCPIVVKIGMQTN